MRFTKCKVIFEGGLLGISEGSVAGPGGVEGGPGGGGGEGGDGEGRKEENAEVASKGPGGGAEPGHQCFIGMVVSRNLYLGKTLFKVL